MLKKSKLLSLFMTFVLILATVFSSGTPAIALYVPNPAKIVGADAELADNVKTLSGVKYITKDMEIKDLLKPGFSYSEGKIISSDITGASATSPNGGDMSSLKYPLNSRLMVLDRTTSNFAPQKGDIYIDPASNNAFRILDAPTTDSSGNKAIPVITPEFSEVFKSYKIPEQTVKLNKDNISFTRAGVRVTQRAETTVKKPLFPNRTAYSVPSSKFMSGSIPYSVPGPGAAPFPDIVVGQPLAFDGYPNLSDASGSDDVLFELNLNKITLYEYPEPKDEEEDPDKLTEDESQTPSDDGSLKDNQTDTSEEDKEQKDTPPPSLKGVEEKNELSMKVYVDSGKIIIHKPTFFANVDIGVLEQEIKLGLDYKTDMSLTIKGDLKFDKVVETLLLGYDVEIPYGKAFVGVFLVVDAKGQVSVTTKITTSGHIETGFKAAAVCFVPYYVGPYCAYKPDTFDVSFTADGEIKAKAAAVPKIGLTILDFNIGELQLWAGVKANAKFHIEAGAHADLNNLSNSTASGQGTGSLKIDFFVELIGYLFNARYDIFYKEFNLFDGSWTVGEQAGGGGGDENIPTIPANISIMADAYYDVIKGSVKSSYDGTPYQGANLNIHVQHTNGQIDNKTISTDQNGKFEIKASDLDLVKTILPTDKVWADINSSVAFKKGLTAASSIWIDQSAAGTASSQTDLQIARLKGQTQQTEPTVPFDKVSFVADAFNDIVRGQVSGEYTGPIAIIYQKQGPTSLLSPVQIGAYATKGEFIKEFGANQIKKGDKFTVKIPFEGVYYPKYPETKEASLPYLKINFSYTQVSANNLAVNDINGTIQNLMGEYDQQYNGSVKNMGGDSSSQSSTDGYVPGEPGKYNSAYRGNVELIPIYTTNSKAIAAMKAIPFYTSSGSLKVIPGSLQDALSANAARSSSKFNFNGLTMLGFKIRIVHDGIEKYVTYSPLDKQRFNQSLQEAVTNPVEDKIDSVINPSDLNQWAGVWEAEYFGTIVLRVDGDKLVGVCDGGFLSVEASVKDGKLTGMVENNGDKTPFELALSSDGKIAQGKWYLRTGVSNSFSAARRKLPSVNVLSKNIPKTSWTGIWYTVKGTMILNQEGSKVTGTLGGEENPITATIEGSTLKGTFSENGYVKAFELDFTSNGEEFEGTFEDGSDADLADWYGYRTEAALIELQ